MQKPKRPAKCVPLAVHRTCLRCVERMLERRQLRKYNNYCHNKDVLLSVRRPGCAQKKHVCLTCSAQNSCLRYATDLFAGPTSPTRCFATAWWNRQSARFPGSRKSINRPSFWLQGLDKLTKRGCPTLFLASRLMANLS